MLKSVRLPLDTKTENYYIDIEPIVSLRYEHSSRSNTSVTYRRVISNTNIYSLFQGGLFTDYINNISYQGDYLRTESNIISTFHNYKSISKGIFLSASLSYIRSKHGYIWERNIDGVNQTLKAVLSDFIGERYQAMGSVSKTFSTWKSYVKIDAL